MLIDGIVLGLIGAFMGALSGLFVIPALFDGSAANEKNLGKMLGVWVILILIGGIACGYLGYTMPEKQKDYLGYDIIPIYSSDLSTELHGTFVLGSGNVDSDPVYYVYSGDPKTGLSLVSFPTSRSKIFLDENENPHVREIHWINGVTGEKMFYPFETFELHIPENSIKRDYNMGLDSL